MFGESVNICRQAGTDPSLFRGANWAIHPADRGSVCTEKGFYLDKFWRGLTVLWTEVAETSCWVLVYLEKILGLENIEKSKLTIAHLSTVLVNLFFNIFWGYFCGNCGTPHWECIIVRKTLFVFPHPYCSVKSLPGVTGRDTNLGPRPYLALQQAGALLTEPRPPKI